MKTDFIPFSGIGAVALFASGVLFGNVLFSVGASRGEITASFIMAVLLLMLARNDAREPIENGNYDRSFFFWKRQKNQTSNPPRS